jgi:predicted acyltransferase
LIFLVKTAAQDRLPVVRCVPYLSRMVTKNSSTRLVSLDALRGFDMCWILGMGAVLEAVLARFLPGSALTTLVQQQLSHVDWEGLHFEDLIFPLFLFISGVSMAIAVPRREARDGRAAVIRHLLLRAAIIFFLGVIASGGMSQGIDQVRWLGVIQRIGVASAVAGIASLWLGFRGLSLLTLALLVGYWLLMLFVPVPGVGVGEFTEGRNLTNYLDSIWLPGRKYDGTHDPEGILSTLPAIGTALIGLIAGKWLTQAEVTGRRLGWLVAAGFALLVLGWAWHPWFPVVKKLWSSSFVLVAAGWSMLLLAVFIWVVDILAWRRWCKVFIWVGANPLSLYLASGLGAFRSINARLVGPLGPDWKWIGSLTVFGLMILTARWLYKRGIFLRI